MRKKILVIYTSVGYGHKKIGENIADVLRADHEVDTMDILTAVGGKTASQGTKIYLNILKYLPGLWKFFYTNKLFLAATLPFRTTVARFKAIKVANLIINEHYDIIICTQVTASAIISYLKQKKMFNGKFVIAFSDFHLHPYWLFKNADLYLANIVEQKELMIAKGIPEEIIYICGITLPIPEEVDKEQARIKYGLTGNDKMILVLGGGRGLGIESETVSQLIKSDAKVFIVCGLNAEVKNKMEKFFSGPNVKIFGFIDYLQELYAIADIIVTKPGGLTLAECLEQRAPILVTSYIPGGEKMNLDYLRDNNLVMPEFMDVLGPVEDELKTGSFAKDIRSNEKVKNVVQHGSIIKEAINNL
ncbi:MAG: UDP-N-acetylglucosamine:LPS N-acetylglucosamine transferase [Candidatus Doudnabacteria bacterium]|nr:UDP-N-acetylglucosamine:LPS N-acetylglucosamine transferase [Candidatus Doudnabacteria bacterium]